MLRDRADDRVDACWYSLPNIEDYVLYDRRDYERWATEHPDCPISRPMLREQLEYMLGEFEIPTVDEGFTSVRGVQEDIPNTIDVSE